MNAVKGFIFSAVALLGLVGTGYIFVEFYPFIFSRKVSGVLVSVERLQLNVSLMQTSEQTVNPQLYSFALAIREDSGEIVAASAEDRQWAAATKGNCVEAVFYPYPPWKVMKAGTYYNARLDRLSDCPDKAAQALRSQEVTPPAVAPGSSNQ